MNKEFYEKLLELINLEEKEVKKNSFYIFIITTFLSILFWFNIYHIGIFINLLYIGMIVVLETQILKDRKERVCELKYSKNILKNNTQLKEELASGKLNSKRGYLLTENFFLDFNRKNVIKFDEIKKVKLKFSFSFIPFSKLYGLSQYVSIITYNNIEIKVLNWSFNHLYPEDSEIYDIFLEKTKNK